MEKRYRHILIALGIGCLALLPVTYVWFVIGGIFPTGENISKGDWLGFWGGYLSFAGATILGAIAVWQNNQANKTNQTAIEENRRIYQISFENELRKAKYLAIIHAIEKVNKRWAEIEEEFLTLLHYTEDSQQDDDIISAYQKTIENLNFVMHFEFECMFPSSFDEQYPQLKIYRENMKQQLESTISSLEDEKTAMMQRIEKGQRVEINKVTIYTNPKELNEILRFFYDKLYALDGYISGLDPALKQSKK